MAKATGIIWVGPVFDPGGYGSVSRNLLLGLKKINCPARVLHLGNDRRDLLPKSLVEQLLSMKNADVGSNPVGIMHFPPEYYPKIAFKDVSKRIGYTIFETDRIPGEWVKLCNELDEVWVPSKFNLETFSSSGVEKEKIKVLPYGIDTDFFRPADDILNIEGKRGFSFLYVFAFDWRKGFDLLLDAYNEEFSGSDDVTLILKVFKPDYFSGQGNIKDLILGSLSATKSNPPHVVIIDEHLGIEGMKKLYNSCDLYISTDRANGWGMPCMEAMSMGKPAATIDWSGSTEFMTENNSLLIKPTGNLIPVDERLVAYRPFYKGHKWAEVKVNEVRRVMRFAYENRKIINQIAERGRLDITRHFSLEEIAKKMVALISDVPEQRDRNVEPSCIIKYTARERMYYLKLKVINFMKS